MIRFSRMELTQAIRWLSSNAFEDVPFEIIAVVLDKEANAETTTLLNKPEIASKFHFRKNGLLLTLNPQEEAPNMPTPLRDGPLKDWATKFSKIVSGFNIAPQDNPFDVILDILPITQDMLPLCYVRFKGMLPILVPFQDASNGLEVLSKLFDLANELEFTGEAPQLSRIEQVLNECSACAIPVNIEHQKAFDAGIDNRPLNSPTGEQFHILSRLKKGGVPMDSWPHVSTYTFAYRELLDKLRPLLPDHLNKRLHTAAVAHLMEDYGSVCSNIGAVIEGSLAGSVVHVVRGDFGIDLPQYIDQYDPDAGKKSIRGIPLNAFGELIGTPNSTVRIRWKAPMLNQQLMLLPHASKEKQLSINLELEEWQSLTTIAHQIAKVRNPAAHGANSTLEQAEHAWSQLGKWYQTGCATTLHQIREALQDWPNIPSNILANIQPHFFELKVRQEQILGRWLNKAKTDRRNAFEQRSLQNDINELEMLSATLEALVQTTDKPTDILAFPIDELKSLRNEKIDKWLPLCEPITQLTKAKKRLRKALNTHLKTSSTIYKELGSLLNVDQDLPRDWLQTVENHISNKRAHYRKEDSKTKLVKKLDRIFLLEQQYNHLDNSWFSTIKENLKLTVTTLQGNLKNLQKEEREIQQRKDTSKRIEDCVIKMYTARTVGTTFVCHCKTHDLEALKQGLDIT